MSKQQKQGLVHIQIGGKKRPLYFGLCTFMDLQDQYGDITLDEINETISSLKDGRNYKFLFVLIWSGLLNGAIEKGEEFEYSLRQVGHWVDGLTQDDFVAIFDTLAESKFFGEESEEGSGDEPGDKKK